MADSSEDHRPSMATWSSSMPSSTARFDCRASPRHMAPAGSSAKNRPAKAPGLPRNARNESTANTRISRAACARREPCTGTETGPGSSFIGKTTNTVTLRIQAVTKKKVA